MKTIGVDLDDVLLNFNDSFLRFHNENYGTNFERKDVTQFEVEKLWSITALELQERFQKFYGSDQHKNAEPVEGAIDAIEELAKNNKLVIITSSPQSVEKSVREWLKNHFKDKFEDIHFTKKSTFDHDKRRNKGEMCQELGIDVFIDDHPDNAESISACGIPVYLIDTPWNQYEAGPLVKRVYSWKEIVDDLNGL